MPNFEKPCFIKDQFDQTDQAVVKEVKQALDKASDDPIVGRSGYFVSQSGRLRESIRG